MPIDIELTQGDLLRIDSEAKRRQSHNEARKLKGRNMAPSRGQTALDMHRIGCTGELAVAKYLQLEDHVFGNEKPIRGSTDLPGAIEVKTRSKHGYDLLIQLDDSSDKLFVLVTYEKDKNESIAKIIGWAYGFDVMRSDYIREFVRGRPCYAVPQLKLNKPETLQQELTAPTKPSRILSPNEAWITQENNEMILNFGKELLDLLGWEPGDILSWDINPASNSCYLRKIDDCKTAIK